MTRVSIPHRGQLLEFDTESIEALEVRFDENVDTFHTEFGTAVRYSRGPTAAILTVRLRASNNEDHEDRG